jgi:hypothetical protein
MSQQDRQSRRPRRKIARGIPKRTQALYRESIPTDLLQCSAALVRPVPDLRKTYPPATVVLAMLSQSAAYLRSLLEEQLVTHEQARQACREFETYVLKDPLRQRNNLPVPVR